MSVLFLTFCTCVLSTFHQGQGHPCKETPSVSPSGTKVNCQAHHLHHIPPDLPRDTVWLDFSNNALYNLTDYIFHDLPSLVHLDLTNCSVSILEAKAFAGLGNIHVLILANNILSLDNKTYPQDIFIPLTNLTYLDIGKNERKFEGMTPDKVFMNLPNLRTLYIDTFKGEIFGSGFSVMTQLNTLVLSNYRTHCFIVSLYNNTFHAFQNSSIAILDMEHCHLEDLEIGVYLPLHHISEIVLTQVSRIFVNKAISSLFGLNGRNITRLKFNNLFSKYPQEMYPDTMKDLTDLCVEYLDLSNSFLMSLRKDSFIKFAKCIKHLDLSQNYLSDAVEVFVILNAFDMLEYFDVSHQKFSIRGDKPLVGKEELQLPVKLAVFNVSGFNICPFFEVDDPFSRGSALNVLNISYDGMSRMTHRIKGIENVANLDVSGNNGGGLTGDFIQSFPNVRQLTMNGIAPGQLAFATVSSLYKGIKNLTHVESISLESNNIQDLGSDIFNDMINLTYISLANNGFAAIPFDLVSISQLAHLDLSLNYFTYLTTETTQILDKLERGHGFHLKLRQNPLSCFCQALYFIKWLFTTRVVLDNGGDYNCVTYDGEYTTTLKVYQHWNYHWTGCQGRFWLPFAITFMCFVAMVLLASVRLTRNWTLVQHRIMIILGRGVQRVTRRDFKNDAYIAHSEEDGRVVMVNAREGLERFGLRLIIPDRDFLPGRYVADNVVESVNGSWKTVLIVTDSFLDDPWSYFIMRTVSYSVSYPNSNRVILLIIGDVNRGRLPESLLNVTEEEDILETDDFPGPDSVMWTEIRDRVLSEALQAYN